MTNSDIIFSESQKLLKEGKINPTGRMLTVEVNGKKEQVPEAETIHTFEVWKALGFRVKKGTHAVAKFKIWKYSNRRKKDALEDEEQEGRYYMHDAYFFAMSQVEAV